MPGALLFFISFVVFQKRHRFLEKRLGGKILKPNIIYVVVKFKRERRLLLDWVLHGGFLQNDRDSGHNKI